MIQKKWFRIETDGDCAILSCEEVSSRGKQTKRIVGVRFYYAHNKAEAIRQARSRHVRKRASQSARDARLYKERTALNTCRKCNRQPAPNRTRCAFHLKRDAESARRRANLQRKGGAS